MCSSLAATFAEQLRSYTYFREACSLLQEEFHMQEHTFQRPIRKEKNVEDIYK